MYKTVSSTEVSHLHILAGRSAQNLSSPLPKPQLYKCAGWAGQTSVVPCLKRQLPPQLSTAQPLAVTTSSPGKRVANAPLSVARLQIQHLEPLALHLYLAVVHALQPAQGPQLLCKGDSAA